MRISRRELLTGAAATLACGRWTAAFRAQTPGATRLILLGTRGGPRVGPGRSGPSTLLLINGVPYVVDCGVGTSRQLATAGVPLNTLRYLFFTHLHSDHMLEYGPIVYNAWVTGLRAGVDAYGPPGAAAAIHAFWEYMKFDVATRMADEGRPDPRPLLTPHEITGPGVVMRNDDVTVTAAVVAHPPIEHAFGFRFDTRDRSIVISGDTNLSSNLIALAKGADVLVHEVLHLPGVDRLVGQVPNAATLRKNVIDSHTISEDAGRVAAEAGVKTLVLSHFVPGDDPGITDEMWSEGARRRFHGRIIVGKDLMEI